MSVAVNELSICLPSDRSAVGRARAHVAGILDEHPHALGAKDDVLLLTSEAFTNAVVHTPSPEIGLKVKIRPGLVHVEVIDSGTDGEPTVMDTSVRDPMATHGRGMDLIELLSAEWGFCRLTKEEDGHAGCCVWFDVSF